MLYLTVDRGVFVVDFAMAECISANQSYADSGCVGTKSDQFKLICSFLVFFGIIMR